MLTLGIQFQCFILEDSTTHTLSDKTINTID